MDEHQQDTLVSLLLAGLFLVIWGLNLPIPLAGALFALVAGLYHAYIIGKRLTPGAGQAGRLAMGGLILLALNACIQTIWFYADGRLNASSDGWTLVLTFVVCHILTLRPVLGQTEDQGSEPWSLGRSAWACGLLACAAFSAVFVWRGALMAATSASIRTPWPLLPSNTLPAIGLIWLSGIVSARFVRSRALTTLHAMLGIGALTAIVPLLYRVGYGFDGFLHLSGERILADTGTLMPKPPYYIGQYVFTTWLARLIDLPDALATIDRYLVPIFASLALPFCLMIGRKQDAARSALALGLLPLAAFVATTPQSFAYVLGLCALLLAQGVGSSGIAARASLVLATWAIAVHPLAGIPFFLMSMAVCLVRLGSEKLRRTRMVLAALLTLATGLAIPMAFFLISSNAGTHIDWDLSRLWSGSPWIAALQGIAPWIGTTYSLWPGWASLVQQGLPTLLLVITIIWAIRTRKQGKRVDTWILIGGALSLLIAAAALRTAGDFAFLIDYERGNYAERLVLIATFCAWAASLPAIADVYGRLTNAPPLQQTLVAWTLCTLSVGLAYDALPRHDALIIGHGWSVGSSDIEAVRAIDHDAGDVPYTVLADQSVSAAAVSQLGFKRYAGDTFFYPIPTGGPLYAIFLDVAAAKRIGDNVADAGDMGGSKLVYVVLNDYWWQAEQVEESLGAVAHASWTYGDPTQGPGHAVYVYKFDLTKASTRDAAKPGS